MPSPALLSYMINRPISADEYLLWAIADGGEQFQTSMPAYKDKLSREDIWKVIAYMRAGFPETTRKEQFEGSLPDPSAVIQPKFWEDFEDPVLSGLIESPAAPAPAP